MDNDDRHRLGNRLRRIANEIAELPGVRWLAKPLYRRQFQRPYRGGNAYFGIYDSHAQARAAAPPALPASYDIAGAGGMYRDRHAAIRVSDYPAVYWLQRLIASGERRIFDLGGHIGVSYYGFGRYLDYPADLHWLVHDVPAVAVAGRDWAATHDSAGLLHFSDFREDASGRDVLLTSGALQYLDYTLPQMLGGLRQPPRHVLVNLVPMHPRRSFFTLQNIGKAVLPYRVDAVPEFVAQMQALGYVQQDSWSSTERNLRIPFSPHHGVDSYRGFYFRRDAAAAGEAVATTEAPTEAPTATMAPIALAAMAASAA